LCNDVLTARSVTTCQEQEADDSIIEDDGHSSANASDTSVDSNSGSNDDDDSDWRSYKLLNKTTTDIAVPLCQRLQTFKLQGDTVSS
jgi:hypothetical protein